MVYIIHVTLLINWLLVKILDVIPERHLTAPLTCICDLSRFWLSCLGPLVFKLPISFELFGFSIFWPWPYMVKVIPESAMHTKFVISIFIIINTLLLCSVTNVKINHTMVLFLLCFFFCEGVVTMVTNLLERKIIFILCQIIYDVLNWKKYNFVYVVFLDNWLKNLLVLF